MTRWWARYVAYIGLLCLGGLGFVFWRAGSDGDPAGLRGSVVFLVLTLLLALSGALMPSRPNVRRPRLMRAFVLTSSAILLAVAASFLFPLSTPSAPEDRSDRLEHGRIRLMSLPAELTRLSRSMVDDWSDIEAARPGESLFRGLDAFLVRWQAENGLDTDLMPEAVLWSEGQRVAWTRDARPLDRPVGVTDIDAGIVRRLTGDRSGWHLQQWSSLTPAIHLELQLPLEGEESPLGGLDLRLTVVGEDVDVGSRKGEEPDVVHVYLASTRGGAVRLVAEDREPAAMLIRRYAVWFMIAMVAWLVALTSFVHLAFGRGWVLVALWIGRALWAEIELLRWVAMAFPGQIFPAGPDSPVSLVDPAYFATPFAFGWFASTADALISTFLLAATAWWLLTRRRTPLRDREPASITAGLPLWVRGLLFGGIGGVLLAGLRFMAGLLAENANARLIGTGASLSYLSFWGLHVALMLASFSLAALVTTFAGGRTWPGRQRLATWLGAGGLAMVTTGSLVAVGGAAFTGSGLAAIVTAGLWLAGSVLSARSSILRRFVWPAVILVTVAWNYASLREIYDHAERSWLQRKGGLITQADQDWTRYLLGSVLEEMRDRDPGIAESSGAGDDIWRDEAAWKIWRDSALRDLGYACLVELVDAEGGEQSLFARGYLRDYRYEIADRSYWMGPDGQPLGSEPVSGAIFQVERRIYAGGEEEVLAAEIPRNRERGWIRVELPLRSWRITTQLKSLGGARDLTATGYRPRAEIDRPVALMLADDSGWLAAGAAGYPSAEFDGLLEQMRRGEREWGVFEMSGAEWLCRWSPLPPEAARTPGEGFVMGLRRPGPAANLLDLSRLMLLNLLLYFLFYGIREASRLLAGFASSAPQRWTPGFQERFLSGYLLLGLVLLLVVGTSVDRVGYERVRAEARDRTRSGMSLAVEQLRSLLVEQAVALAESEYIADLLRGELAGNRPVGPMESRQGMVFAADGTLLLDETLSDLEADAARDLLQAGREAPMVVVHEGGVLYAGTVIPLDLGGFLGEVSDLGGDLGHGDDAPDGFFFYRQVLDSDLIGGLADLARGQATLRFDGTPVLASHPGDVFAGRAPLLADPQMMAVLFEHPAGTGVFASSDRPFAFTGTHPLPAFGRNDQGRLVRRIAPAILALDFPDREREHVVQRRANVLFLAGLANLILLTALALALLMSWNIFRPLRLLLNATRSLGQGDFAAPLPEAGRDEVGQLAGAFGLMRGELASARTRLEEREQFLTTVLDRVTVGVAVLDSDGRAVTINPEGRTILTGLFPGTSDEEALPRLATAFDSIMGAGGRAGEYRTADGRRTLRGATAPLALPDGRTDTMVVFEDVTEFLATQKMAINAELARQVAHEIKNPLTPIQLSVQLLDQARRDGHPDFDRILADTVTRVLNQVTLLRSIASEFSLLGRPGELDIASLDLPDLVAEVVAGYGAQSEGVAPTGSGDTTAVGDAAPPQVRMAHRDVPPVEAHRESLLKILGNLMQNSLDAASGNGSVCVEVDWRIAAHSVTMVWQDNGTGLPADVADRLFDPYFSTKSKGTGLGLAICRNLADRMGGRITLTNRTDGAGARAELELPRTGGKDIA